MRPLVLCALILSGCATAPPYSNSTEALAEQKRQALANRRKENEKQQEAMRLAVRKVYVQDHPELSADIRKAILKERITTGMSVWQVVAAYSLWEYTKDPQMAKYRNAGTVPLWTLADWRQTAAGDIPQEQWALQRKAETRYLYFESGRLKKWKD